MAPPSSCVASCSSGASSAVTCADLSACCTSIQDAGIKRGSTASLSGANGDDASCAAIYPSYADYCH